MCGRTSAVEFHVRLHVRSAVRTNWEPFGPFAYECPLLNFMYGRTSAVELHVQLHVRRAVRASLEPLGPFTSEGSFLNFMYGRTSAVEFHVRLHVRSTVCSESGSMPFVGQGLSTNAATGPQ